MGSFRTCFRTSRSSTLVKNVFCMSYVYVAVPQEGSLGSERWASPFNDGDFWPAWGCSLLLFSQMRLSMRWSGWPDFPTFSTGSPRCDVSFWTRGRPSEYEISVWAARSWAPIKNDTVQNRDVHGVHCEWGKNQSNDKQRVPSQTNSNDYNLFRSMNLMVKRDILPICCSV